jgi:hypothetical protein
LDPAPQDYYTFKASENVLIDLGEPSAPEGLSVTTNFDLLDAADFLKVEGAVIKMRDDLKAP